MTEGLRLRPVFESDLARLEQMFTDPEAIGVYNWGGFTDPSRWRRRFADDQLLSDEKSVLMIDLDGVGIGFVS